MFSYFLSHEERESERVRGRSAVCLLGEGFTFRNYYYYYHHYYKYLKPKEKDAQSAGDRRKVPRKYEQGSAEFLFVLRRSVFVSLLLRARRIHFYFHSRLREHESEQA